MDFWNIAWKYFLVLGIIGMITYPLVGGWCLFCAFVLFLVRSRDA